MQNTYVFWRASHPLIFIATHLIVGISFVQLLPPLANQVATLHSIFIFITGIVLLGMISLKSTLKSVDALLISIILLSWGIAIKWAAQTHDLFTFPYPTSFIIECRNWVIVKINKTIEAKEAKGFALAILLGIKADMNTGLTNAYMQLGIIHIMAISGMHLEILFKNLKHITGRLPKNVFFNNLELIVLLTSVWTYTLMAFASPSIVRAAVSFSFFTVGKFIGTHIFVLNTIAGGILILLLFNMKGLTHIGLQLSYAAVVGIHLFYKLLNQSIEIDNPIIQFLWSNCCISLAAQLTTFPILILHFHQIAGWVLVSNFIMVPLSNLILYGLGILLILPIHFWITPIWGHLVAQYITYFNHFVEDWFLQTKAASIQISMNEMQVAVYYLVLLFVYLWLYLKKSTYLIAILGVFSLSMLLKLFSSH